MTTTGAPGIAVARDDLELPGAPEEITAEWMTRALEVENPGVTVTSLHLGEVIWGTATKVRVLLDYDQAGHEDGLPATLLVKAGFGKHELTADMLNFYVAEVEFYREVAPSLDIGLPRCYFAGLDPSSGNGLVVLEDLLARNTTFTPPAGTVTPEVAADALEFQARYHGATWDGAGLDGIATYPGALREVLLKVIQGDYWEGCLSKPRAEPMPAALREPDGMRRAIESLWEWDAANVTCLGHGDAHVGNMYVDRDGSPGFVDWQMAGRNHWSHDVAYFVIGALEPQDRRERERDLLAHYLERLQADGGQPPSFDEAWDAYRRHAVHGVFWAANPDGMYPEETNRAMVERYSLATEELETLSLLPD